jgi:hypothetical protein
LATPDAAVTINPEQLERAITLVFYYLNEAQRILGKSAGDPNIYLAALVLEWIKRNRPDQIFPIADVYQRGPTQIRIAKKAKNIMQILQEHGHVIEITDAEIDGKKIHSAWGLVKCEENK